MTTMQKFHWPAIATIHPQRMHMLADKVRASFLVQRKADRVLVGLGDEIPALDRHIKALMSQRMESAYRSGIADAVTYMLNEDFSRPTAQAFLDYCKTAAERPHELDIEDGKAA